MIHGSQNSGLGQIVAASLVCPRDHRDLLFEAGALRCESGHRYAVIEGIPILLLEETTQTHGAAQRSLDTVRSGEKTSGIVDATGGAAHGVDPFVQQAVVHTGGCLYTPLIGALRSYPIPQPKFPLASGPHQLFLDIGCNWGRWCVAASRVGYQPIGIDPNIEAVLAARRVTRALEVQTDFVVGDARYLPFASATFDLVFSYSVLQHFSKPNAEAAIAESGRVTKSGGCVRIQLAGKLGLRSLYHQAKRGFQDPGGFGVRFWTPAQMRERFEHDVGATDLEPDAYLILNAPPADLSVLPPHYRALAHLSNLFCRVGAFVPAVVNLADSINVVARRR